MQRLTLASLLVTTLILWGCESGTSTGPVAITFAPTTPSGQGFVALYAPPPFDVVPYPNDLYNPVVQGTGPTLAVPARQTTPLAGALNTLDGFSTVAKITAPFNAAMDLATLIPFNFLAPTGTETVFVLDATNGVPLIPGVDYAVSVSSSAGAGGSVLEISPLRPLAPQTTYVFILTSGILSATGVAAGADQSFGAVRDAHLAGLMSVPGAPELDPLFPAITPLIDTAVGVFSLPGDSVVVAWSATTQSITNVLDEIKTIADASLPLSALASAGITTAQVNPALPGIADIYVGVMDVPYYGDPQDTLGSVWVTLNLTPPTAADPVPFPRVPALSIPVLATLPNVGVQPPDGWPVVIYQHGVTSDRSTLLAIADTFASQGFAVVAIDLPLHGIPDPANPFYQGPENLANPFGNNERHFFLDNFDAVGQPIPDGVIDDGRQIFNLSNPLNARDHIRQAVSDLFHLTRAIPTMDFPDGDAQFDLDPGAIHLVGVSLGSNFANVFLGLTTNVSTATMSSPFAPWSLILADEQAVEFGAPLRAGLAAAGIAQGTVLFDDFLRDLQTVLDPADSVNYAAATASNHPLHVVAVIGDDRVPVRTTDNIARLWGLADVTAANPVLIAPGGARGIVRFNDTGGHTSLLDPSFDPAMTTEMQTQMVTFAVTGGTTIAITDTTVVQ